MKRVSELRFGFIDAERYIHNPDDPLSELFRRSFYKSQHLAGVVDPDVYFVLGEKGTGKTAYAVYASLYMKDTFNADCEFFDKNDFTRFIEVARDLQIEKSQYSSIWVFIFLISLVQRLDKRGWLSESEDIRHVVDAIKAINLGGYAEGFSKCIETVSEITLLFNLFAGSSDLNIPSSVLRGAKPIFKLTRLTEVCISALGHFSSDLQFALYIDGLDVRPEEVAYPDYLGVVSSICNAIWVLSATQLSRIPPTLKVTIPSTARHF